MNSFYAILALLVSHLPFVSSFCLPVGCRLDKPAESFPSRIGKVPREAPRILDRQRQVVGAYGTDSVLCVPTSLSSGIRALHNSENYVLTVVLLLSTFGVSMEHRTSIGKALSAPLATMALALTTANIGLLPFQSPIYNIVPRFLVPLAVPLLLFDSDLKRVLKDTGTVLAAFGVGALATVIGTIVAYPIFPLKNIGIDVGWRIACALAARHIGGAINFVAVAETLALEGGVVSAAIAADNIVVAIYFAFLFSTSKGEMAQDTAIENHSFSGHSAQGSTISEVLLEEGRHSSITLQTIGMSLAVSSMLVSIGKLATYFLLPTNTSSLPMISVLTVLAATLFPPFFARISEAGTALGVTFIQMFFAVSGAAGSIRLVMQQAPALFAFSALQIAIHYGVLMYLGRRCFRLPKKELYLASNANIGGPTTAAAMAKAKSWSCLILPALLVGILGYALATPIALGLVPILSRLSLQ